MSRLAFGIPTQTGAQSFRREVEGSLAGWRDLIEKDDARVVRSIHLPPVPNSIDGPMPVTIYQLALRSTGKVVQLSIQGKHEALPNPITTWSETQKRRNTSSRSRSDSDGGKMAAKRRLQAIHEDDEAHCGAGAAANFAHCGYGAEEDSGFDADASSEYAGGDEADDNYSRFKRARTPCVPQVEGPSVWNADAYYDDDCLGGPGDISMQTAVHVNLHPPTPRKPSKPSSRKPRPPRYSVRASRSASMAPNYTYGANDVRHTPLAPVASTAASDVGETQSAAESWVTTAESDANSAKTVRRSSRLASMPPGHLEDVYEHEHDAVLDAASRLSGVALSEAGGANDVDMSSINIQYVDPEEARLAHEQEQAERQRQRALEALPAPPHEYALRGSVGLDGRRIKSEPEMAA